MTPQQLVKSVYLGDRGCKAILIDSWNERVAIQVTCISRLEPGTPTWNYYTGGDIENGWIVFSDVRSISFDPTGPVPNDFINDFAVEQIGSQYLFTLSISSATSVTNSEVVVRIEAARVHLEDPAKPGIEIIS